MMPQQFPQHIAGQALVLCHNCGANVRENLLTDHAKRYRALQQMRVADVQVQQSAKESITVD